MLLKPPVTRTLPEGNIVDVCLYRATASEPVGPHVPRLGSKISQDVRELVLYPPVTRTLPDGKRVYV